jgi:hypothetical protein
VCAAAERLVAALTQQLYCVPETSARSLKDAAAAADKALEATVNVYKQQQVSACVCGGGQHQVSHMGLGDSPICVVSTSSSGC